MAANVRTFHAGRSASVVQDNPRIAHARVQLKLGALAYDGATRRAPPGSPLRRSGLAMLTNAAIAYVEALESRDRSRLVDRGLVNDDDSGMPGHGDDPRIFAGRQNLKLAAFAYEASRHGADGGSGFCRAGLGMVCQFSIRYVETLDNTDKSDLIDRTLQLDDGM